MSGGFFRGTSADQDTRFSNKQAKLLKSQKFAPELENLVDITKVKMDVMRPWIAHRVTELLGFEDEVLINFIYGLLEGKEINGKEIQISLTGFMEKNTGKFMKELWTLLISAQNNASGIPQQFLDAKEEETKKNKAETERITNEIQKKKEKEGRELELERMKKMDVEVDNSRANDAALDRSSRHQPRGSNIRPADEETNGRNGSRGRSRVSRSPRSTERSSSPPRRRPSRSISKSVSNSRSLSNERQRSRSISGSPQSRGRSISSEKVRTSPRRRSVSPRSRDSPRRSVSPRRGPSNYRRRSISRTRQRSPSPLRRRLRSPVRRRSRSPIRRRSRSPMRRRSRSPLLRRSRSPIRRPPIRYRSRSPIRRRSRSPIRLRSPSPSRRRSPSPIRRRYRRSPSTPRRRSVSPVRRRPTVPGRRRSPTPPRRRSPSSQEGSSQSPPPRRAPPSPVRRSPKRQRRSPVQSPRDRTRTLEKRSPVRRGPPRDTERPVETRKGSDSLVRRPTVSLRSPQRDPGDRNDSRIKLPALSPSPYKSPSASESPPADRKRSPSEDRRSVSPYESPVKQTRERIIHDRSPSPPRKSRERKLINDTPETSAEDEETNHARDEAQKFKSTGKRSMQSSTTGSRKDPAEKALYKDKHSPERLTSHHSGETRGRRDSIDLRKKDQETKSETISGRARYPEGPQQEPSTTLKGTLPSERVREPYLGDEDRSRSRPNDVKGTEKLPRIVERDEKIGFMDSGSEESDRHRVEINEKRKPRKSKRSEVTSDDEYSDDSQIEGRKEAKKRRKEEKRLKKEERRKRREERRRRKEERRLEKLKMRTAGTIEKNHDGNASGERVSRRDSHSSDIEEAEAEQKKLEIELREKALESLRAKKGVNN